MNAKSCPEDGSQQSEVRRWDLRQGCERGILISGQGFPDTGQDKVRIGSSLRIPMLTWATFAGSGQDKNQHRVFTQTANVDTGQRFPVPRSEFRTQRSKVRICKVRALQSSTFAGQHFPVLRPEFRIARAEWMLKSGQSHAHPSDPGHARQREM